MKAPLFALALLATFVTSARAGDFLSAQEKKQILDQLDDNASDSWDESDAEVAFVNLECDSAATECTIFWRKRYQGDDQFTGGGSDPRNLAKHPWGAVKACPIHGVRTLKEASDAAYGAFDKCFYAE